MVVPGRLIVVGSGSAIAIADGKCAAAPGWAGSSGGHHRVAVLDGVGEVVRWQLTRVIPAALPVGDGAVGACCTGWRVDGGRGWVGPSAVSVGDASASAGMRPNPVMQSMTIWATEAYTMLSSFHVRSAQAS